MIALAVGAHAINLEADKPDVKIMSYYVDCDTANDPDCGNYKPNRIMEQNKDKAADESKAADEGTTAS